MSLDFHRISFITDVIHVGLAVADQFRT